MSASDDLTPLDQALRRAAAALGDAEIPFVVGGSIACWVRGGPRVTNDVDLMIAPEDAEAALAALQQAGMEPERLPESWLLKARDPEGVCVDLIFRPLGVRIDHDYIAGCEQLAVLAMPMRVMSAGDVLVSRLLAIDERHIDYTAHVAIARALREQVDWDALARRVARSPYARGFLALAHELGISPDAPPSPRTGAIHVHRHEAPVSWGRRPEPVPLALPGPARPDPARDPHARGRGPPPMSSVCGG